MNHTPGPWHADRLIPEDSAYLRTVRAGDDHIAHVLDLTDASDEARANARLIAAAPELLAALQAVMHWWAESPPPNGADDEMPVQIFDAAYAAIAKATGCTQ